MDNKKLNKTTGLFILFIITASIISQGGLILKFVYPDFSKYTIGQLLVKYHSGGPTMGFFWFLFALSSLSLIPLSIMLFKIINDKGYLMIIGTALGSLTGLFYTIGIMRWVLFAGNMADRYVNPSTTSQQKDIIELLFKAVDTYAGNSFGETLAPITHSVWLVILGAYMIKSQMFWKWISWIQIISGLLIFLRPLEYVGLKALGELSDMGLLFWNGMLVFIAANLLRVNNAKTSSV